MENKVTLYIATHNTTGLKYFGKTRRYFTEKDLQKYYHGSGKLWKEHLTEFGDNVTMEIYGMFPEEDVVNKALTFSLVNDIVESDIWKNDKVENGLDGGSMGFIHSQETKDKISFINKGKIRTKETLKLMSEVQLGKKLSKETKNKMSKAKLKMTDETKNKLSEV